MNTRDWVIHVKLLTLPPDQRAHLLSYLSDDERKRIEGLPEVSDEKREDKPFFSLIHWSWYLHFLEAYTKEEQKLFINILPTKIRQRLNQEIGLPPLPAPKLKRALRSYLEKTLRSLIAPHVLPLNYLPQNKLNILLTLNRKELIKLIDTLSLFDLIIELKQIVETKILKKIYSFLSDEEKAFLKMIPIKTTSLSSVRARLEGFDGTKESLRHLLHRKGLARLGIALSGAPKDLIWYLAHLLDIGRGTVLLKYSNMKISEEIHEEIEEQIRMILPKMERK